MLLCIAHFFSSSLSLSLSLHLSLPHSHTHTLSVSISLSPSLSFALSLPLTHILCQSMYVCIYPSLSSTLPLIFSSLYIISISLSFPSFFRFHRDQVCDLLREVRRFFFDHGECSLASWMLSIQRSYRQQVRYNFLVLVTSIHFINIIFGVYC